MRPKYIIRFQESHFTNLQSRLRKAEDEDKESQIFIGFSKATTADKHILISRMMICPDDSDLKEQCGGCVEPDIQFQNIAYGLILEQGFILSDVHNHPFQENPDFSAIDNHYGKQNVRGLAKYTDQNVVMVMLVFGKELDQVKARIWDRKSGQFEDVGRIEVHGSPPSNCLPNQ